MKIHIIRTSLSALTLLSLLGCQTTESTSNHEDVVSSATTGVVADGYVPEPLPLPVLPQPPVAVEVVEEPIVVQSQIVEVSRVSTHLTGPSLKTLNQADELLSLSNQQYNDLVAILEERTVQWKSLMSQEKAMSAVDYQVKKRELFSDYSKKMTALFTSEQVKLWRAR